MGRKVDKLAKAVRKNSGNASDGSWTLTGAAKADRILTDHKKKPKGPRTRGQ